ncbi:MAG: BMC domain-containing protein [Planctomycetota bacterium]|nr:MAG: BMC domain-containing protein [Planctomycetota bacterium]
MRIHFDPKQAKPAVAMLETTSIGRGLLAVDGILKTASVKVLLSTPTSPGNYISIFTGEVGDVESSLNRGIELAGTSYKDHFLLPNIHPQALSALFHIQPLKENLEAVGILESNKMASLLEAADASAKAAEIDMIHIHLGIGIGGYSFAVFVGPFGEVETSLKEGTRLLLEKDALKEEILIGQADPQMVQILLQAKLPERNSLS